MDNHDEHYRNIEQSGIEPIRIMEELHKRLLLQGVEPEKALNIALAQKHITRAGMKAGNDWGREIEKAINYLTRAKTGEWFDGKYSAELEKRNAKLQKEVTQLKTELKAALNSPALMREREEVLSEKERFNDDDFTVTADQTKMYFNGKTYNAVTGDDCSDCAFYGICIDGLCKGCRPDERRDNTSIVWVEKS